MLTVWAESAQALLEVLESRGVAHVVMDAVRPGGLELLVDDSGPLGLESATDGESGKTPIGIYGSHGRQGTDHLGFSLLPEPLAATLLKHPLASGLGPVGRPEERFSSLAYRLIYQQGADSGLPWRDPAQGEESDSTRLLRQRMADAKIELPLTQRALHNHLVALGYGVTPERLQAYVAHDIARGQKVFFHAWLLNQLPGEMNLFLIRQSALDHRVEDRLMERLSGLYEILASKPIDANARQRALKHIRGGRWARGGPPALAVVVFDPNPRPTSEDQRRVHPYVFNAKQLIKQDWREWFVSATGDDDNANPIHSTDNEAEAMACLPLFFDRREQEQIRARLRKLRGASASIGADLSGGTQSTAGDS